jgi:hypothetical protein
MLRFGLLHCEVEREMALFKRVPLSMSRLSRSCKPAFWYQIIRMKCQVGLIASQASHPECCIRVGGLACREGWIDTEGMLAGRCMSAAWDGCGYREMQA